MAHDVRDRVVDYVHHWKDRTEITAGRILRWIGVPEGTFYSWKQRYGKVNEHNGLPFRWKHGHVIIGSKTGRSERSSNFTGSTRSMAIDV